MSEPRKNHLSIDGGQIKEDENVATYKPIPDADADFKSKPTLSKSKEKISDEAEEKLLDKDTEAKIVTRVDMADAKYVVGDHRNGDAKIELDANKRQFSGLTKEELLKYADDPFWVRLRWFMFVLFWLLWLCMLAGAVAIIIRAPKCAAPTPKTWYELGPLVDTTPTATLDGLQDDLDLLKNAGVQAVFADAGSPYEELSQPDGLERLKRFVDKAKEFGVKVIVELTPNFVSTTHDWFKLSVNGTKPYDDFFTWRKGRGFVEGNASEPNNWVSTQDTPAWTYNEDRKEFYLNQFGADRPDLNFHNPAVVEKFDQVLKDVMKTGAQGVRLHKVREALVDQSIPDEVATPSARGAAGADHRSYAYYQHRHTSDQPQLDGLLRRWAKVVDDSGSAPGTGDTVFTIAEDSGRQELSLARNTSVLRPRAAAPVALRAGDVASFVHELKKKLDGDHWSAVELKLEPEDEEAEAELAALALLLPAAPVLRLTQLIPENNDTSDNEKLSHLVTLREDASVKHGKYELAAARAADPAQLLVACARWKKGHTGYVGVFNPHAAEARANLTLASVPPALTVHHVSARVRDYTNYTSNKVLNRDDILVPPKSTVVLSYVPVDGAEQ